MAQKCVHKGCGKVFSDESEPCVYHPGPPIFHEGQKGWKCCKPRVLTFDEFLAIPPCTTGKHSTVDDTPAPEPQPAASIEDDATPAAAATSVSNGTPQAEPALPAPAARIPQNQPPASPAPPESDSDEPDASIPAGLTCKRRGCNATSDSNSSSSSSTSCVYHPGQALFHEGSKGWTCCKKRVLEFDEFMKIPGCKTRERHCFVGKKKKKKKAPPQLDKAVDAESAAKADDDDEEVERLATVRSDFYQTPSAVHASFYLKKIEKDKSRVVFRESGGEVELALRTADGKVFESVVPLFGKIEPGKSAFKILGTKLELTLAKADGAGWPVLRSDERPTGEIIQTGRAGRA